MVERTPPASPAEPEEKGACPVCGCEEVDHRNLWTCRCPAPAPGFNAVDPGRPYYATPPASPAEPRCYECDEPLTAPVCPACNPTPPAPAATDEEVARMVKWLKNQVPGCDDPADYTADDRKMLLAADLLARVAKERDLAVGFRKEAEQRFHEALADKDATEAQLAKAKEALTDIEAFCSHEDFLRDVVYTVRDIARAALAAMEAGDGPA